ncbi:gliding motility-associated C-terminal domain-containing protein, partial [Flavobacterium sp. LS1R49]
GSGTAAPKTTPATPVVTVTQPTCALPLGSIELSGLPSGNWTINPGNITGNTPTKTITGLMPGNTYSFTVTNDTGCTSVSSTNVTMWNVICANTETTTSINGYTGGKTEALTANDKLSGIDVVIGNNSGEVILTPVNVPAGLTLNPDGTVTVAPNTPAGNYNVEYRICEAANQANCAQVISIVPVIAPSLTIDVNSYCSNDVPYVSYNVKADNFTPTGLLTVSWVDNTNKVITTLTNLPLSGKLLWPGTTIDVNGNGLNWPGWLFVNGQWVETKDGSASIKSGVKIIFSLDADVSKNVDYPTGCRIKPRFNIEADDDDVVFADGINGSLEVINVLENDKLNGAIIKNPADVILKGLTVPSGITLNADGTVDVAPNTRGGNYVLTYQICEAANTSNCITAKVTIFVEVPSITIIKTAVLNDENKDSYANVGETITYSFKITNTGNTPLLNVMVSDPLPNLILTGTPISLNVNETDENSFEGTYVITQKDINAGKISNLATVFGTSTNGIKVDDQSENISKLDDNPTVSPIEDCVIKIFNAMSPNGDNKNERFYIQGLECYPDNTVEIYNRWGVLVFEREHYNNEERAFRGLSEGRTTVKQSDGLPVGTYYYVLKYKGSQSKAHQEAGYLYISK